MDDYITIPADEYISPSKLRQILSGLRAVGFNGKTAEGRTAYLTALMDLENAIFDWRTGRVKQ
jgi:hypothetical protein